MTEQQSTKERIKRVLIESLNLEGMEPEMIGDDDPLFGDGLGLDSVDALELVVALEKEYGVRIASDDIDQEAFASISKMAGFVEKLQAEAGAEQTG